MAQQLGYVAEGYDRPGAAGGDDGRGGGDGRDDLGGEAGGDRQGVRHLGKLSGPRDRTGDRAGESGIDRTQLIVGGGGRAGCDGVRRAWAADYHAVVAMPTMAPIEPMLAAPRRRAARARGKHDGCEPHGVHDGARGSGGDRASGIRAQAGGDRAGWGHIQAGGEEQADQAGGSGQAARAREAAGPPDSPPRQEQRSDGTGR